MNLHLPIMANMMFYIFLNVQLSTECRRLGPLFIAETASEYNKIKKQCVRKFENLKFEDYGQYA